jgi:hypothetical protein
MQPLRASGCQDRREPPVARNIAAILSERLDKVRTLLAESRQINEGACPKVGLAKQWALRHTEYRLEAEVTYLTDLLNAANNIVCDVNSGKGGFLLTFGDDAPTKQP